MNTQKEKVLKMAKTMDRVLKTIGIVLILVIISQVVLISPLISLDPSEGTTTVVDIWGIHLPSSGDANAFRASMIITMIRTGIMATILFAASFVFGDIGRENTPFTKKSSDKIRVISLLLLANEILLSPLKILLLMVLVPGADAAVSFSIGNIIAAVIFLCLSLVFGYGCALQKESDEIL